MENPSQLSVWQLVRAGFWLGVGFLVPSALFGLAWVSWMGLAMSAFDPEELLGVPFEGMLSPDFDRAEQVELGPWHSEWHGRQLLILGTVSNAGDSKVGSVRVEAELFDAQGAFVYECSKYISGDLQAGATENYQIKCGSRKEGPPAHEKVEVRVANASVF